MNGTQRPRALRIAYLGPQASFSHQAAVEAFPQAEPDDLTPLPSFEATLSAIQNSAPLPTSDEKSETYFDYALLPVENSTNGGVVPVLDLLVQSGQKPQTSSYPDLEIVGEHYLTVHHCLFAHQALVDKVGSTDLKDLDIKILYSHPQVWGQCNRYLAANLPLPDVERIHVSSTSAAATFVAQDSNTNEDHDAISTIANDPAQIPKSSRVGNRAAVCSAMAGERNGLVRLAANIEDEPGRNQTRFFIIRNRHRVSSTCSDELACPLTNSSTPTISWKSLITFTIAHTKPGSLAGALAVFSKHNFNLTAITTRPSQEQSWHYVFFVECEQQRADKEDGSKTQEMLAELGTATEWSTLLGSWVNRLKHKR